MSLIVQKYGGSSLATPAHIQRAAARIKAEKSAGHDTVVVVSAMGRTTDHLIALAGKTVKVPPRRELDMLMTAGERISMSLLAMALHELGVPAISFTGSQSGIVTTGHHTEARILAIRGHRIQEELQKGKAVIIAGFQGVSELKEITTLGRGGSDTTAVALAAILKADYCEILTDVNGLFTADPRLVPNARVLPRLSYDEALELASLGAKMQPRSLEVAKRFQVRVKITSSSEPACQGTWVQDISLEGVEMEETAVRGIATRDGYHFFKVKMPIERLMQALKNERVLIRYFNESDGTVRFVCEKEKAAVVKEIVTAAGASFEEIPKVMLLSAVGEGMSSSVETLPDFYSVLSASGCTPLLVCANALSITAVILSTAKENVTQKMHEAFIGK